MKRWRGRLNHNICHWLWCWLIFWLFTNLFAYLINFLGFVFPSLIAMKSISWKSSFSFSYFSWFLTFGKSFLFLLFSLRFLNIFAILHPTGSLTSFDRLYVTFYFHFQFQFPIFLSRLFLWLKKWNKKKNESWKL